MKLEKKVTSLELSKKLKELGYPQEGLWWWKILGSYPPVLVSDSSKLALLPNHNINHTLSVAPTVAELGEDLPAKIEFDVIAGCRQIFYLYITKDSPDNWDCFYASNNGQTRYHSEDSNTEANARAKMWIYLKEEGLI